MSDVVYVLDSGAVSALAARTTRAAGILAVLTSEGCWPPVVPSAVLVECLTGRPELDARINQFLKSCDIDGHLGERRARRAARLRTSAGRGSAVDAIVVATAEPGGTVVTGDTKDTKDVGTLAAYAASVDMLDL